MPAVRKDQRRLVPGPLADRLLPDRFPRIPLRRCLIIGGLLFHGGILVLLDAGVFPFAIFTAYVGLLREDDWVWIRNVGERRSPCTTATERRCVLAVPETSSLACGLGYREFLP